MTSSSLESCWHSLLLVAPVLANKGGGDVGSFGGTLGSLLLEDGELDDDTSSDLWLVASVVDAVVAVGSWAVGAGSSLLLVLLLISCFSAFVDSMI